MIKTGRDYERESVGVPAAAPTAEIKDSLDFEAVICQYLGDRRRILSHYFAE